MKTINDLKTSEGISMPQECINFIGPPDLLIGQVIFENTSNNDFHIPDLRLEHEKLKKLNDLRFEAFQVNSDLKAGQRLMQRVRISLDPQTLPAIYDMDVFIGGIGKKIKLIIQPNVSIEVNPGEVNFLGIEPGLSHHAEIQVSNKGNVPVNLPSGENETELAEKSILRCLTGAVKESANKSSMETLEVFFHKIRQELENGVRISFEEPGQSLNPGESTTLHLVFTLPSEIKDQQQYDGIIKIFNDKLSYKIIGSPKAEPVKKLVKRIITKK